MYVLYRLCLQTFKLGLHKGAVMPVLGAYLVTYLQANAVLTGNVAESRLNVNGSEANDRIQVLFAARARKTRALDFRED